VAVRALWYGREGAQLLLVLEHQNKEAVKLFLEARVGAKEPRTHVTTIHDHRSVVDRAEALSRSSRRRAARSVAGVGGGYPFRGTSAFTPSTTDRWRVLNAYARLVYIRSSLSILLCKKVHGHAR
jgi:hypothetical protein